MVNNLVLLLEDILVSPASLVSPLQECTACLRADIPVCLEVTQVRLVDIPVRLVDILVRLEVSLVRLVDIPVLLVDIPVLLEVTQVLLVDIQARLEDILVLLEDILANLVSPRQECTACLQADIPVLLEVSLVRLVDILVRLARLLVNTPNQEAQRLEVQARSATKRARTRRTRKPARTRRTRRRAVPPQAQAAALTLRFNSQGPHTGRCPILVWEVILA